jgi:uncharacterized protein (DUF885 family)
MRGLVFAAATVVAGWGEAPADDAPAAYARVVDAYFDARFAAYPTQGTAAGLHEYDGRLDDLSREAIGRRVAVLKEQLEALTAVERAGLEFDDAIDAEFLEAQMRGELLDLEGLETWRNPMRYASLPGEAVDGLIKRDFAPAAARLRSLIERERRIPAVFAAARANVANPPAEFTDLAIRMAKGSIGFFEGSVVTWAHAATGGDAGLKAEFDEVNGQVVRELAEFARWLEEDLRPRSKGTYAIGAEAFARKLRYEEMIEAPLAEVLARGEANLERDYRAFVETARAIDPARTPAEVMASISDAHPTAEDLIPSVRRSVEAAREFLIAKGIVTVPSEVRVRVEETPPYARSGGFASMDTPGPYEMKAREAYYYVTPVEPDWDETHREEHLRLFNDPVVAMINVHEAYPGHYLQFLYAPRFKTKVRKLLSCGTNVEGWAHYTEQMMVDEGFGGGDPRVRLAQLQEALLRDCRYVAGIKLHTEGWTVERAARELFEAKGFQEPANAYEEARRGAYNPTYLYYTYGKLDILDLRSDYLKFHENADLRAFHDAFVELGGLPLPLVRRVLLR